MPRIQSIVVLVSVMLASGPGTSAQDVDALERRIVSEVETEAAAAVELLEQAVNINSGTMNFEGVRAVGRLFRGEFDALGFETEWIDGAAFERAGHLIARRDGDGRRLLLIGHLDTVFELDSPFQTFSRDGDRATGPGVVDMKGGGVVIVHALGALARAGILEGAAITVIMTGDEERAGTPLEAARAALREAAAEADIVLAFENGDSNPATAVVARRGSTGWTLEVTGTPAHSSQVFQPHVGMGAIYEAARILGAFRERLDEEPLLTFNPGMILGGTDVEYDSFDSGGTAFGKNNVVAEHALVTGDLRAISLAQLEAARRVMNEVVADNLPGTSAAITFGDGYPPLAATDGNRELLTAFDQVSRDLGFGPVTAVDPRNAGAADVSFTAGLADAALDGLGPGGGGGHTVNEWIDLPTLEMQTRRAAVLIYRLTRP